MNRSALLPNLLTLGNGVCGFAAMIKLSKVGYSGGELTGGENLTFAAYLILLGMIFDVFDGKFARTFGGGSELGAQLDSLCDLVTFGLVPAFMITRLSIGHPIGWQNVAWFFALSYFLGALLRLARFNVENSPDEGAHLAFKGLPTPAAAGCIASLVILQRYLLVSEASEIHLVREWLGEEAIASFGGSLTFALAFLAPVLGFTMVSDRLEFDHMGSKLFGRGLSFNFQVYLIFAVVLLAMVPEIVLPLAFWGYLCRTPLYFLYRTISPKAASLNVGDEKSSD